MAAYYSEFDPKAAAWLRELIKRGLIADGVVDERDLWDVAPADLRDFTQVHLCAGIGVWSYALRRAGWPDDRPVWTASFPCQPFSAAGKGEGFADERHLWPAGQWLIEQCRPAVVFGEQVASKDAEPWLDLVQADLEALGYAVGAVPFPSAGVGAPHIRDRLFWVGHANNSGLEGHTGDGGAAGRARSYRPVATPSVLGGMGNPKLQQRQDGKPGICTEHDTGGRVEGATALAGLCSDCGLADLHSDGRDKARKRIAAPRNDGAFRDGGVATGKSTASPTNGLWADADWLFCRDGKWRAVEPGSFPLAHGAASRVGRLRAYGNAINAEAAKEFIAAYM